MRRKCLGISIPCQSNFAAAQTTWRFAKRNSANILESSTTVMHQVQENESQKKTNPSRSSGYSAWACCIHVGYCPPNSSDCLKNLNKRTTTASEKTVVEIRPIRPQFLRRTHLKGPFSELRPDGATHSGNSTSWVKNKRTGNEGFNQLTQDNGFSNSNWSIIT